MSSRMPHRSDSAEFSDMNSTLFRLSLNTRPLDTSENSMSSTPSNNSTPLSSFPSNSRPISFTPSDNSTRLSSLSGNSRPTSFRFSNNSTHLNSFPGNSRPTSIRFSNNSTPSGNSRPTSFRFSNNSTPSGNSRPTSFRFSNNSTPSGNSRPTPSDNSTLSHLGATWHDSDSSCSDSDSAGEDDSSAEEDRGSPASGVTDGAAGVVRQKRAVRSRSAKDKPKKYRIRCRGTPNWFLVEEEGRAKMTRIPKPVPCGPNIGVVKIQIYHDKGNRCVVTLLDQVTQSFLAVCPGTHRIYWDPGNQGQTTMEPESCYADGEGVSAATPSSCSSSCSSAEAVQLIPPNNCFFEMVKTDHYTFKPLTSPDKCLSYREDGQLMLVKEAKNPVFALHLAIGVCCCPICSRVKWRRIKVKVSLCCGTRCGAAHPTPNRHCPSGDGPRVARE